MAKNPFARPSAVKTFKNNVSGLGQNRNEAFLRPDQAVDIINMHADDEGSWSSDRAGYLRLNVDPHTAGQAMGPLGQTYATTTTAGYENNSRVAGLFDWVDGTDTHHLIMAINGKLKEVSIVTGLDSTKDGSAGYGSNANVEFMAMNNVLYTVDGTINTPRVWDGATGSNSGGFPINDTVNTYSRPSYVVAYQGRAVYLNFQFGTGGDSRYPSHIGISNLNQPETFTLPAVAADDATVIEIFSGDGQQIRGARSIFIPNSNDEQLVIFKDRSTFIMQGNSAKPEDTDVFRVSRLNNSYGAINNRTIVQVGNDIFALNVFGVTSFTASADAGSIQPNAINSDLVKNVVARMNRNAKDTCWSIHLPARREVWFFLPTGSSSFPNEAVVLKYPPPNTTEDIPPKWSRRTDTASKFICTHGVLYDSSTFYIGTSTGIVGEMFASSKYDDTGVPYKYEHPETDFDLPKQYKQVLSGEVRFNSRTTTSLTVSTKWGQGGNSENIETVSIGSGTGTAVYGVAVFGVDTYSAPQSSTIAPLHVRGNGCTLKTTISGTNGDVGVSYLGTSFVFEPGGFRI